MTRDEVTIGARWLKILDRFRVRFVALDLESDRELAEFFSSQPGWIVDCRDAESVLFVRTDDVRERGRLAALQGSAVST